MRRMTISSLTISVLLVAAATYLSPVGAFSAMPCNPCLTFKPCCVPVFYPSSRHAMLETLSGRAVHAFDMQQIGISHTDVWTIDRLSLC